MVSFPRRTLAIIGQGYVGLPLAMAAVDAGWMVIGIDNIEAKVARINSGSSPIEGISNIQLADALIKGKYIASADFSSVAQASVIAICVPTPLSQNREPDLSFLRSATTSIAPYISNETLVVSESTSHPGTLRNIIMPIINSLKPQTAVDVYFTSAPERVNPGDLIWNQKNTPRLIGAINEESKVRAFEFYKSICSSVVSTSTPEVAEAAKLLENTFRLVNIAFINEFAQLCSMSGIDVNEVIDAASTKPYGFMPFMPGIGVGGHCIPVDPIYLTWWARQYGGRALMVETADSVNRDIPQYISRRTLNLVGESVKNPRVLIMGVAYKSGVSDVRETPVSRLRSELILQGANVAWHDPLVSVWEGTQPVELSWECDVAVLAIKQPGMDLEPLLRKSVQILDCTNSLKGSIGVTSL